MPKGYNAGGIRKHPLYSVWAGIYSRCYISTHEAFKYYGARGVKMCDEWLNNPSSFIEWANTNGWERGLDIDKDIKGNGLLYSPDTCSIVTHQINIAHRKDIIIISYNGESRCLKEWAEILNMNRNTLQNRIRRYRWSVSRAFTQQTHKSRIRS